MGSFRGSTTLACQTHKRISSVQTFLWASELVERVVFGLPRWDRLKSVYHMHINQIINIISSVETFLRASELVVSVVFGCLVLGQAVPYTYRELLIKAIILPRTRYIWPGKRSQILFCFANKWNEELRAQTIICTYTSYQWTGQQSSILVCFSF